MRSLKEDIHKRLLNNNQSIVFSTFSGKGYTSVQIESYYFNIITHVDPISSTIIFLADSSLESHILSLFLILSEYDVILISNFSDQILSIYSDSTIITLSSKTYNDIKELNINNKVIQASRLDGFVKWSHPSFNLKDLSNTFYKSSKVGKSIFQSSGSTGNPKLIPLTYNQINSCYNNVYNGFLNSLDFKNIVSLHDTSFVIILPFLFCLAAKGDSKLLASEYQSLSNPILNFSSNINSIENFIIISVPSIFRLLFKLLKDSFVNLLTESNIITCGEPLDKNLALKINAARPLSFLNLYGSTEVSPWIIYLDVINFINTFENIENIPSVLPAGKSLPSVQLQLSLSNELLVNASSVFDGYENLENSKVFTTIESCKFYRTGDQFERRDELYFCKGRINSSLKVAGVFVNPILLEIEIKSKTNLENLLIIPHEIKAQLIILFFNQSPLSLTKEISTLIKNTINNNTSKNIPLQIILEKDEIIYLKSGKINRQYYKEKYLQC